MGAQMKMRQKNNKSKYDEWDKSDIKMRKPRMDRQYTQI